MTKRVRYNQRRLCIVDHQGMTYRDDGGGEYRIDFAECRRGWVAYVNAAEELRTNLASDNTTCVAWRDITAKPPYIEFFTMPRTRFEFVPGNWLVTWFPLWVRRQVERDFVELHRLITRYGWSTLDLS